MAAIFDMMLTIITATTTTAAISHTAVFGAIGVVVLITLLITKELSSASENGTALLLSRITDVTIHPLLFAFLIIVSVRVMAAL